MKAFLISVLTLCGVTAFADPVSSFSTLPAGDELRIHYVTEGCFHRATTDFRFTADPKPQMTVVRTDPRHREDPPEKIRTTTGKIIFRPEEAAGLDRLLEVYRTKPTFASTTAHHITITQMRGDQVIATETFKHYGPRSDAKDIPTFDILSEKIGPTQ